MAFTVLTAHNETVIQLTDIFEGFLGGGGVIYNAVIMILL